MTDPTPPGTRQVTTRFGVLALEHGYPSAAAVEALYDELDFQRACQAYVWATPAVALEALRRANARDWGVGDNTVGVVDRYTTPAVKALTGNDTTIYAAVFVDLGRDGPVVIDSPEGVYGVIDDAWQRPIVEVGPFGPDKGAGGKFLLLPPGHTGAAPAGYFAAPAATHRALFLGRAFVRGDDVAAAVATLAGIRVYPLAQADAPPPTRVVRSGDRPLDSIAPRGFAYWELLAAVLAHEPVEPRDRFFHAMLRPLGLAKGQPFAPDPRQTRLLTEAAAAGFLMAQTLSMAPRLANAPGYPGTHWEWVLTLNPDQEAEHHSQLDERTDYTFEAITVAAGMVRPIVGAGSQYMSAAKDREGRWLDGGRAYRLRVPPAVPVREFWALTVYDNLTRSMIDTDTQRPGVSSRHDPAANADGSVDLYFGPTPPFFDQTWTLPDLEPVD